MSYFYGVDLANFTKTSSYIADNLDKMADVAPSND